MMKKLILTGIIILGLFLGGFSQNCGYMGKRFMINADVILSPAYINPNFLGNNGYLSFNYLFSPNIEIIAWNKGSVGFVGNMLTSQYKIYTYDEYGFYNIPHNVPFAAFGYGIYYKQYFSGSKAPFGSYVKTEFDFMHFQHFPNNEAETEMNFKPDYGLMAGMKFEIGKDFLFFNRLKLSLGASVGIPFTGWGGLFDNDTNPEDAASKRVNGIYWLGFRMGIGFLAF